MMMEKKKKLNPLQQQISKHNLFNYTWLQKRLNRISPLQLIKDFELFIEDESVQLLKKALLLSMHILIRDKSALGSQLLGRLSEYDVLDIQNLLSQIKNNRNINQIWLRPLTQSLTAPSDPLLYTFYGKGSKAHAIAITPDGNTLISCGFDLKIWDLNLNDELVLLSEAQDRWEDIAVTPDNQYLIAKQSGIGNAIEVWSLDTRHKLNSLFPNDYTRWVNNEIHKLAISLDGNFLVAKRTKDVVLFNLLNRERPITLETDGWVLECITISQNNRYIIAGALFPTLYIWDIQNPNVFAKLKGHMNSISAVTVIPNGHKIISASIDNTLKVWDLESRSELFTLSGHLDAVSSVAVTPNGQFAVSGSRDNTIKIWDLEEKKEIATFYGHSHSINDIAVTPDGQHVVSSAMDDAIKVWDLSRLSLTDNEQKQTRTYPGHHKTIHKLALTPDGETVISASEDGNLKIWSVSTGQLRRTLIGHKGAVCSIAITPDGTKIVSASADQTLKIWDIEIENDLMTLTGHQKTVEDVAITTMFSTQMIISASDDNTIKIWHLDSGEEMMTLDDHVGPVTAVAVTPDDRKAISVAIESTGTNKMVKVWDLPKSEVQFTLAGTGSRLNDSVSKFGRFRTILVTPDGLHLITIAREHKLFVWNLDDGSEVSTMSVPPTKRVCRFESVTVTQDSKQIITGSTDGTIRIWDKLSGEELHSFTAHAASVNALAFVPYGNQFVSVSTDHTLKVWDLDSGAHVATFYGDGIFTTCVIAPNGTIVAGEATGRIHFLELMGV